jgi:hypothetical protein
MNEWLLLAEGIGKYNASLYFKTFWITFETQKKELLTKRINYIESSPCKPKCCSARQEILLFFAELEGCLPCSQKPATGPYPEPGEYNSHSHILFKIHFNIILP